MQFLAFFTVALAGHIGEAGEAEDGLRFESERFQALEFVPRFESASCYIELHVQTGDEAEIASLKNAVADYLYGHEYKAAGFPVIAEVVDGFAIRLEIRLIDECDRRRAISDALVETLERDNDDRHTSIEASPPEDRARQFTSYWTDDPEYDPIYWERRLKAQNGDFQALMDWARDSEAADHGQPWGSLYLYRWAENCAANDEQRMQSRNAVERLTATLSRNAVSLADDTARHFAPILRSYGVKCLPMSPE